MSFSKKGLPTAYVAFEQEDKEILQSNGRSLQVGLFYSRNTSVTKKMADAVEIPHIF